MTDWYIKPEDAATLTYSIDCELCDGKKIVYPPGTTDAQVEEYEAMPMVRAMRCMCDMETVCVWLSFVGDAGFLGGALMCPADGTIDAIRRAHELGVNPGGEVRGTQLTQLPPGWPVNTLLSRERIRVLEARANQTLFTSAEFLELPIASRECPNRPVGLGHDWEYTASADTHRCRSCPVVVTA